jgi:hypothetical protein
MAATPSLAELLATADAEEYAVHFRREGFRTVREVLDAGLTQRDLDSMGVTNADARNRIVRALFRSNYAADAPEEQQLEDDTLSLWLSELGVEKLCAPLFRAEGFGSLEEVVDARLSEEDLKDLGLETMKARKAVLQSLTELAAEASSGAGERDGGLGAAAEATFVQSYQRHRRLSAASLTSQGDSSYQSAAGSSSGSDGEFVGSDDDGEEDENDGGEEEGLFRAIGVRPAGDLQTPLLDSPPGGGGQQGEEEAEEGSGGDGGCPHRARLALVLASTLGIGAGFTLLWLASYSFNLGQLFERETEGYRLDDSLLEVASLLFIACISLLAAATLSCCRRRHGGGCRRAAAGASVVAVLTLPALTIGSGLKLLLLALRLGGEEDGPELRCENAPLPLPGFLCKSDHFTKTDSGRRLKEKSERFRRLVASALALLLLPIACAGIAWSRLLGGVRKTPFLRCHSIINIIFLPRQALDKHRENSKKSWRFP